MLRKQFYNELNKINYQLLELSRMVVEQLRYSIDSLQRFDRNLARSVIEKDKSVNQLETTLVEEALALIALQQPVSSDLRQVISVLKSSADLERIGDHAVSISKACLDLDGSNNIEVESNLTKLGEMVIAVLTDSIESYYEEDSEKVVHIASRDDRVNLLFQQIENEVLCFMKESVDNLEIGHLYLQIAMHLERIGDYSKNFCEWIVYRQTGEHLHL